MCVVGGGGVVLPKLPTILLENVGGFRPPIIVFVFLEFVRKTLHDKYHKRLDI